MIKYALIAALTALVVALGWIMWQGRSMAALESDNARLTRNEAVLLGQAEQARIAMDVADARAKRSDQMNAQTSAEIETILSLKGSCLDETLDPDIARIIGRWNVPAKD